MPELFSDASSHGTEDDNEKWKLNGEHRGLVYPFKLSHNQKSAKKKKKKEKKKKE